MNILIRNVLLFLSRLLLRPLLEQFELNQFHRCLKMIQSYDEFAYGAFELWIKKENNTNLVHDAECSTSQAFVVLPFEIFCVWHFHNQKNFITTKTLLTKNFLLQKFAGFISIYWIVIQCDSTRLVSTRTATHKLKYGQACAHAAWKHTHTCIHTLVIADGK